MKQTKTQKKSFDLFSQKNRNWGAEERGKSSELAQTQDEYKFTAFLTSKLTSPLLSQFSLLSQVGENTSEHGHCHTEYKNWKQNYTFWEYGIPEIFIFESNR